MKSVMLVLAYVTLAASSARDKRSYAHAHTQAYPVPVSVHTVVRPSNTLPVYEYPESTQIDTHSNTVYSVSVPITHTVHLEQPGHSRQVIYHNPPAVPSYSSYAPQYTQQYTPQYTQQYTQQYTPQYTQQYTQQYTPQYTQQYTQQYTPQYTQQYTQQYTPHHTPVYTPHAQRRVYTYTPARPWVYRRYDPWC